MTCLELIGVSEEDFEKIYNRKWKSKVDENVYPFNYFCHREWSGATYVTVQPSDPYSDDIADNVTPNDKTIMKHGIDNVAISRMIGDIVKASGLWQKALLQLFQDGKSPASMKPLATCESATTSTTATGMPAPVNTPAAESKTAKPMDINKPHQGTPSMALFAGAAAVTPMTQHTPLSTEDAMMKLTNDMSSLDVSQVDNPKKLEKVSWHHTFEMMSFLDKSQIDTPKGEVMLTSNKGGTPAMWVRQSSTHRGGKLRRSKQCQAKHMMLHVMTETRDMALADRDNLIGKAYVDSVSTPLFKYDGHNRVLLVPDANIQGRLQATGSMMD